MAKTKKLNWPKIWKEYKRLGIPPDRWNPSHIDMDGSEHKVIISYRASGKTTQMLLLACVIWKLYGQLAEYIRLKPIAPKDLAKMFEIIKAFGYVEKLTDGKFHDVRYWGGYFYFCNRDEKGKLIEQSEPVVHVCFASTSNDLKSSYNSLAYITIIDEFMDEQIRGVNIIDILDVLSTVGRERSEFYIFWLGNNLNGYNSILQEFGIARQVRKMAWGEKKQITVNSTRFYVELLKKTFSTDAEKERNDIVVRRFGFAGDKASSITGQGAWNVLHYQHLPEYLSEEKDAEIEKRWIFLNGDFVRCKVMYNKSYGLYVYIKPSRFAPTNKKDIVYTLEELEKHNERYGMGYLKGDKRFYDLIRYKAFYCTNECGSIVEEYIVECNNKQKHIHI